MQLPTVSVVLTINDRPIPVMEKVFHSLGQQGPHAGGWDQLVVVLDRAPQHVKEWVHTHLLMLPSAVVVAVEGAPGWLCPAKAWNVGLGRVTSEVTYCISSEVIQAEGNIVRAKHLLASTQAVVFGKAVESDPDTTKYSVAGGILCSSTNPRPLGFIMALPTWMVRATGGYDEGFMQGYWYDDDDFTFRLWRLGQPFVFADAISGVHQSHERPVLDTPAGQDGIRRNAQYIVSKHGTQHPVVDQLAAGKLSIVEREGLTVWFPHTGGGLLDARVKAWQLPVHPGGGLVTVH